MAATGKIRLDLSSTSIGGTFGIVDVKLNGTTVGNNIQLSDIVQRFEYDITYPLVGQTLGIEILNQIAQEGQCILVTLNGDMEINPSEIDAITADGVTVTIAGTGNTVNMKVGDAFAIAGCDQAEYNGSYTISAKADHAFSGIAVTAPSVTTATGAYKAYLIPDYLTSVTVYDIITTTL